MGFIVDNVLVLVFLFYFQNCNPVPAKGPDLTYKFPVDRRDLNKQDLLHCLDQISFAMRESKPNLKKNHEVIYYF